MSHTLEEIINIKVDRTPSDRCVYFHARPDTGQVFYIGMGSIKRPHVFNGRNRKWRKIVKQCGNPSIIIIAENLTIDKASEIEKFWIKFYGLENLANMSLGGESVVGYVPTEETRKKLSQAGKGRKKTAEQIAKTVQFHKGRKRSEETRRKLSEAAKNRRKKTDEEKEIIASKMRGKTKSIETRRNISLSHIKNQEIFKFEHPKYGIEICTKHELRLKYNLLASNLCAMVKNRSRTVKGWKIVAQY